MTDIAALEMAKAQIESGAALMIGGMVSVYAGHSGGEDWSEDIVTLETLRDLMVARINEEIHQAAANRSDIWLSDWRFDGGRQ